MSTFTKTIFRPRKTFGKLRKIAPIPNLIDIQKKSFDMFLHADPEDEKQKETGLHSVFKSVFPIYDFNEVSSLEYVRYTVETPRASEEECRRKGLTFSSAIKVAIRLITREKSEDGVKKIKSIKEQEVYFGEMPLMTENGTFIINGAERVIVSQLHRSPGVSFEHDKGKTHGSGKIIYSAKINPYRGSWLDFEFDSKDLLHCKIDRRRKMPVTILLRALGYTTEELLNYFYKTESINICDDGKFEKVVDFDLLLGQRAIRDFINPENGKKIVRKNQKIGEKQLVRIKKAGIEFYEVDTIDIIGKVIAEDVVEPETGEVIMESNQEILEDSLDLFREAGVKQVKVLFIDKLNVGSYLRDTLNSDSCDNSEDARVEIFKRLKPGEPATQEASDLLFNNLFFNPERYDLSKVGRLKINFKFGLDESLDTTILTKRDLLETVKYLIDLKDGRGHVDDIDHLGNRRVRPVGELLENHYRMGLIRVERAVRERMTLQEIETMMPHDLINAKPVSIVVKEFFTSGQLSQFMDQTNPLSEVTHKRRLSALGSGGLTRERAGFEVRDVHPTHYGRICPIETPEGPNIGLISSLSTFAKVDEFGFIQTPYQIVEEGNVKEQEIRYFSAFEESGKTIAQADINYSLKGGKINQDHIPARHNGEFTIVKAEEVDLKDVSPLQLVSAAASLIPFLQNDDANRALMGANMQRQAVPLLVSEAPLVGTGMENKLAMDSGVTVTAKKSGWVEYVDANRIVIRADLDLDEGEIPKARYGMFSDVQIYNLTKFTLSNQNTCVNQKPIVAKGDYVKKGEIIADGSSTESGELSLGQNVTVAFMPWGGYNFEDSILISETLLHQDKFTSLHIEEFECIAREAKLGKEEITNDIPTVGDEARSNLDENGIIQVGTEVKRDDILVGKITPKGESPLSPEEKLLRAIFGEKAGDVKDTSLRVPPGVKGTVIGVHVFSRNVDKKDELANSEEKAKLKKDLEDELRISKENLHAQVIKLCCENRLRTDLVGDNSKVLEPAGTKLTPTIMNRIPRKYWQFISVEDDVVNEKLNKLYENFTKREELIHQYYESRIEALTSGDDLPPGVIKMVKIYIATKQKISVGDKLAGRHGNKGVISCILPVEDMPHTADGRPVDVVLNPLGVPSRMNVGQILETHLGRSALELGRKIQDLADKVKITEPLREYLKKIFDQSDLNPSLLDQMSDEEVVSLARRYRNGVPMATPVFDGASEDEIKDFLKLAGCSDTGQVQLYDGKTGEPFDNETTVGTMYILKLHHLVDDKIHARSTGPYSLVTQQPLGGKAQFGGQRLGEMEVWAMEAYGAAYCLQEFLTVKSDDVTGRNRMYEAIVKGKQDIDPGLPESFNVLIKELQSLALDVELLKD